MSDNAEGISRIDINQLNYVLYDVPGMVLPENDSKIDVSSPDSQTTSSSFMGTSTAVAPSELEHKDSDQDMDISFNVFNAEAMEAYDGSASAKNDSAETPIAYSWGRGDLGSLFRPDESSIDGIKQILLFGNRRIIQISSNCYHSAAVTSTGELYVCGSNDEGQVDPSAVDSDNKLVRTIFRPKLFEGIGQHRVCQVACGLYHTVCVTATGHAISFGGNEAGQLGHSSEKISRVLPRTVQFNWRGGKKSILQKVFCGDLSSLFLTTSGEVYSCGVGECTGHSSNKNLAVAEKIDAFLGLNIVALAAGSSHALAVTSAGELYAWGTNTNGQLGLDNDADHVQIPARVNFPTMEKVVGVAAGYSHSVAWTDTGSIYGVGLNKNGQLGISLPRVPIFTDITLDGNICIAAECGTSHTIAIVKSRNDEGASSVMVYGWGSNTFGQVNKESTMSIYRSPYDLTPMLNQEIPPHEALYVAAGGDQSFVIGVLRSHTGAMVASDTGANAKASPLSVYSASSEMLMRRQFSTQASRAVVPIAAAELTRLINRADELHQKSSTGIDPDSRELSAILSTAGELFSSASLLAGSFIDSRSRHLYLDIDGIESFYKALLQLGTTAVVRLIGAIQQTLLELDTATATFPESAVRVLIILWQSPMNSNPLLSADVFKKILSVWSKLPERHRVVMMKGLLDYPYHLLASRILKPVQEHLNHYVESLPIEAANNGNTSYDQLIRIACECLDWLYHATISESSSSSSPSRNILSKDLFYNSAISSLSNNILVTDFVAWRQETAASSKAGQQVNKPSKKRFFISNYPFILNVRAKQRLLLAIVAHEQQQTQQLSLQSVIQSGARIFIPYYIIHVQRENLLQQALIQVASADRMELKKPLKVIFDSEEGVDEGGVTKEFFQLLIQQLLSIEYGMFSSSYDGRSLWINQNCTWCDEEYRLVGILLGLAVYNGVLLDIHFPGVWYQKLLKHKPSLDDLASIDPSLHKGLVQLLQYEPASDVEAVFCRSFEVSWEEFGSTRTEALITNGSNIAVTGENRHLYVDKMVDWILDRSISSQFQQLYDGFTRVIDPSCLLLLRAEELEQLMVGTPHLDFHELETSTEYISANVGGDQTTGSGSVSWGPGHPTIKAFWEVVHDLEFENKQKLLLFITGSKKAPLGGLKNLGLKIQRMCPDSDALPTSHTCFNILMLPEYASKAKLEDRLLKAIHECEGFGLK
jgi:alpha-tubulin suppressor-like RCC1 family protein